MSPQQPPLGLRQLMSMDRVIVKQKFTMCCGKEFELVAPDGNVFMTAVEDPDFLSWLCFGERHSFHMYLTDVQHANVATLHRPYNSGIGKIKVRMGGELTSVVRDSLSFFHRNLHISDAHKNTILKVKGSVFSSKFSILTANKNQVGVIEKEWHPLLNVFSKADTYNIVFPRDLDVRFKLGIISACLLIDYLY